jgi:hypothetical protein
VHITGIALLLGNLVLFELRVFGLGRAIALQPLRAARARRSRWPASGSPRAAAS